MVQSNKAGRTARIVAVSTALVAGVFTVVMVALTSTATSHAAAKAPGSSTPPAAASTAANTPSSGGNPAPKAATLPASQVKTIQQQLAQLHYYMGPIDGVMNAQTVQGITYLQRDSQLPQNGEWNQVTYLAMQRMLASGNSQMGG